MKLMGEIFIGSLTGKTEEGQKEVLERTKQNRKNYRVKVAMTPTMVTPELLKTLKKYGVEKVELEVHSTNSYILKRCGFDYTMKEIKKAARLIKWKRFMLAFQVGIGLPDSNKIDEEKTAKELAKLRPHSVRIYPMIVIKNTRLEEEYYEGRYEPLTLNQAVERCKEEVYAFNRRRVKEISIVTQKELDQSEKLELVAGPYHEEFTDLVTDSIWYDSIVDKIKKFNVKVKKVKIEVYPRELPNIVGYEEENAKKLQELYDVEIKAAGNPVVKPGTAKYTILEVYSD